jgi:hypothetical protein
MSRSTGILSAVLLLAAASTALAQAPMPTSQPNILQIIREEVKVGHGAEHVRTEAGWPALFERTKNPYTYIALVSMTGLDEAWFVIPYQSHEAMADSQKREGEVSAQLAKLWRARTSATAPIPRH